MALLNALEQNQKMKKFKALDRMTIKLLICAQNIKTNVPTKTSAPTKCSMTSMEVAVKREIRNFMAIAMKIFSDEIFSWDLADETFISPRARFAELILFQTLKDIMKMRIYGNAE